MEEPYIAVGIDQSLTNTGLIVITSDEKIQMSKSIKSKKLGNKPVDEVRRIAGLADEIWAEITSVIDQGKNPVIAMEGLAFMVRNTSALVQLAGLSYMLRERLMLNWCVPTVIVAPSSVKKMATLRGNARKEEIMMHVFKRWGFLSENSDTADAYVLARIALALSSGDESRLLKPQKEVISLIRKQL